MFYSNQMTGSDVWQLRGNYALSTCVIRRYRRARFLVALRTSSIAFSRESRILPIQKILLDIRRAIEFPNDKRPRAACVP